MSKIKCMLLTADKTCLVLQRLLLGIGIMMNIYVITYYGFTWADVMTMDFIFNYVFVFICLLMYLLCNIFITEKTYNSVQILFSSGIPVFTIVSGIFWGHIGDSAKVFAVSIGMMFVLENFIFHLCSTWLAFLKTICMSFVFIFPFVVLFELFVGIMIGHKIWRL